MEQRHIHDVIIVDAVYFHAIVAVAGGMYFVVGGINGKIPVVAVAIEKYHRIGLYHLGIGEDGGRAVMDERCHSQGVFALVKVDFVASLVAEPEDVSRLAHNGIAGINILEHE